MPFSLQSTFTYDDTAPPPIDQTEIVIGYPQLEIQTSDSGEAALIGTGQGSLSVPQLISSPRYLVPLPLSDIFGPTYGNVIESYLQPLLTNSQRPVLDDLSISFTVSFGGNTGNATALNALFFVQHVQTSDRAAPGGTGSGTGIPRAVIPRFPLLRPLVPVSKTPLTSTTAPVEPSPIVLNPTSGSTSVVHHVVVDKDNVTSGSPITINPSRLLDGSLYRVAVVDTNAVIDRVMFLVNENEYLQLLSQVFPNITPDDNAILLYLISTIVDLSGSSPALARGVIAYQRAAFSTIISSFGLPANTTAYDNIVAAFPQLFDFPLKMPKVNLLSMAGSVSVTASPTLLSASQFSFYHLSAEYFVGSGTTGQEPSLHISRYTWDSTIAPQNNVVKFSFMDQTDVNSVVGQVSVMLKAFDDSLLYSANFSSNDPALQNLAIVVPLKMPSTLGTPAPAGSLANPNMKIPGKLVSLSKRCTLKGVVVLQAKSSTDHDWKTVSAANSDQDGNFSLPYPYGNYAASQVLVSLDPGHATAVVIDPTSVNESIPSGFMYILLGSPTPDTSTTGASTPGTSTTDPTAIDSDSCSCSKKTMGGRLPTQDDLINDSQYTQDLGGGCVNLLTPNRTLREYNYTALIRSSDPDVANYTLSSITNPDDLSVQYQLTLGGKIQRRLVDLDNPIQWQDVSEIQANLMVYQAVTVSTGHVLYYKSEFRSDGYSLGSLLYSLPLAPGQKREIVTIDASHSLLGSETQAVSQTEQLANDLVNSRNIIDQIAGNIGEQLQGQSQASTDGFSAGLGVSASAGFIGGSLGAAGGFSNSSSSASQDSSRDLGEHFGEVLRQAINQNASSYRGLNATVVTSVKEGQTYNTETTVVANHNHCHAMTMLYFEVLEHFAVFQELVDVEECVFVPFLMTKFSMDNIYKWADVLVTRLLPLPSNTYLKPASFVPGQASHSLIPAFDALERVKTNWQLVDYPATTYDAETITDVQGTLNLTVNIPRPKTRYDFIQSLPIVDKQVTSTTTDVGSVVKAGIAAVLTGGLSFLGGDDGTKTVTQTIQVRAEIFDAFMQLDTNYQTSPPAECIRIMSFNSFSLASLVLGSSFGSNPTFDPTSFFFESTIDKTMWMNYAALLLYPNTVGGVTAMLSYYFQGKLISEWDGIWYNTIAPQLYIVMSENLSIPGAFLNFSALDRYAGGQRSMTVSFIGTLPKTRKDITSLNVLSTSPNVWSLRETSAVFILGNVRITYSTPHYNGLLYSGSANEDLLNINGAILFTPETSAEKRDPKNDDRYLASRLIVHLNQNIEYYNRVLWISLDAQRRFMLLDGFHIQVFDDKGVSTGYRSISSIVKSTLLGVVGNSLVFPVAPGYKVSQNYITEINSDGSQTTESLLEYYQPETPTPPYRLSMQTRGVYSEAVLGACDSCENIKADSSQDWAKFNTDDAPAINPVTPVVPTVTNYNPTIESLAPPVVTIQNAPATPDPGSALAAITTLLGKSGIFDNVTGLDQNQKNALQTLVSDNENAKAFAQMATGVLQQAHNTNNSPQIMSTAKQAKTDGALSQSDYSQLVKSHLQQQIDGGATLKANLDAQRAVQKPTLADAAVSAAASGQNVTASTLDDAGNSQSLSIQNGIGGVPTPSTNVLAQVSPPLTLLEQPDGSLTCWAYAFTMMLAWQQKKPAMTIEQALGTSADPTWLNLYKAGGGLGAGDTPAFAAAYNLTAGPQASYGIDYYVNLVKTYGPIWFAIDAELGTAIFAHARVLVKISGDGTIGNTVFTFADPGYAPNLFSQSFQDFVSSLEQLASASGVQAQILHFAASLP